ncbi:MAG: hypothetical protein MUQ10_04210, partial [Anaerolineae bacterium]|nr:hypothetical protein [Anaerolineae bacterium]
MRKWWIVIAACLVALSLVACSGQVEEPTVSDLESDFVPMLSVTGEVVPAVWTSLSSQVSGT